MKIINLVENTSKTNMKPVHGLSFYIETKQHKILFDLGPDDTMFENAKKKNINLNEVDTVIISHGHYDHGGGLRRFCKENSKAKIYIQESAFEDYYSKVVFFNKYIGLDKQLKNHKNVISLKGDYKIDDELSLFVTKTEDRFKSEANASLLSSRGQDDFKHEQSLIINENKKVLLMGCGHSGVINILENMGSKPDYCIGGFHIYNPVSKKTVSEKQLNILCDELKEYESVNFYTCHCTGTKAFNYLNERYKNIKYISCGDELIVE